MERQIQPEHGLYTAEIRLTRACNLSCRHCSVAAGKKAEDELSTEEIMDLVDQLSDMGVLYVVFTGGEPMLHRDIFSLIGYAASKGLRVFIDTNGTLLSKEKVKALKEAEASTVQVSIDGARKTHDSIREDGSFEKAIVGIKNSIEEGIHTSVNFTVSRLNQDDLPYLIDLAKDLGVEALTMERFAPMGRGEEIKDALQDPEEFKQSLEALFAAEDIKTNSTDPLAVFVKKGLLETYSKKEVKGRICGGCSAGIAALTISYDGEVYPCPKLEVSCGNIRSSTILDIWLNNGTIRNLRFRKFKTSCGACEWKNLCGGCRAVAHAVSGDYLAEDPTCFVEATS
jgi:radical SAM protein with 4Fe4S-binding SPASM domain